MDEEWFALADASSLDPLAEVPDQEPEQLLFVPRKSKLELSRANLSPPPNGGYHNVDILFLDHKHGQS